MTTAPDHITSTAPKRIYLDLGDCAHLVDPTETFATYAAGEMTWSEDNASGCGIPYVRADLAAAEAGALRQIISDSAAALGNGSGMVPTCSLEFMALLPDEIRAVVAPTSPASGALPADERVDFDKWYDAFKFRREYDKYGPVEAAFTVWQAALASRKAVEPSPAPSLTNARLQEIGEMREMLGNIAARVLSEPRPLEFCRKIDAELAALASPQVAPTPAQPSQWQPIETAPKDGRSLLLGARNSHGNWRTMRGQWVTKEEIDDYWEDPDFAEPGWYETAVEAEMPSAWGITPTHWMPLPSEPEGEAAAPALKEQQP